MQDYNTKNSKDNLNKKSLHSKESLITEYIKCKENIPTNSKILLEQSFAKHKWYTLDIIEKYQYFNLNKAHDMIDCGRILFFDKQKHIENGSERLKLDQMFTCKDRFCPFCNWRRARKLSLQSYTILRAIEKSAEVRYLFLTLTVKNPDLSNLRITVKDMMKGFNRLFKYKRIQNSSLGWMRALEVHPQKTNQDKAHPHFHVLLIVPKTYFRPASPLYIKQKEWQALWKKAMNLDYEPSIDIRAIKPKNKEVDAVASVVAETCKYPLKSTDLSQLSQDRFELFVKQMFRVRNLGFGGIFKEYRNMLSLDDVEDGDLIHDLVESDEHLWETIEKLRYVYFNGIYGLNYYEESAAVL